MSLETWKKEFYPVKPSKGMSAIEAVKHSLQKWEGLKAKNLNKHGVEFSTWSRNLSDDETTQELSIDTKTCALCVKFFDDKRESTCIKCPLYMARGGYSCDNETPKEEELSEELDRHTAHPFAQWIDDQNPIPMIRELKKTLKMLEREVLAK